MSRQSTLLGVAYGGMAGANAGVQAAFGNQMSSAAYGNQMQMQSLQALGQGMSALGSMNWGGGGGNNPTAVPTLGLQPLPVNTPGSYGPVTPP